MLQNFVGIFPANYMKKCINFKTNISEKTEIYYFLIANTDSWDKNSTYWWSILDIEPKTNLFLLLIWI